MRSSRVAVAVVVSLFVSALVALVVVAGSDGGDGGATLSTNRSSTTTTTTTTTTTLATATVPTTPSVPPPSGQPAIAVRRGSADRAVVALTFDAGSDTGYAAAILDTLAAKGVRAGFGVTGRWVEANPTLVRRMLAEGHQLVNHSYDHPSFTGVSAGAPPLSRAERVGQLARTEQAIAVAAGATARPWFRPPYGDEDESVRADVGSAGYGYELLWTVDSLGWKGEPADAVVRRCVDGAVPGAIYLFHVGADSTDHLALPAVIDALRARGYGFTTPAEMIDAGDSR